MSIIEQKKELRAYIKGHGAQFFSHPRSPQSEAAYLQDKLRSLPLWTQAPGILAYRSMEKEFPTASILEAAKQAGKPVALPRIEEKNLTFYLWDGSFQSLIRHPFGVEEPNPEVCPPWPGEFTPSLSEATSTPPHPWLCLVPGLAFDSHRRRVGYGAGFYDRWIARLRQDESNLYPKVFFLGIGLSYQLVHGVPVTESDEVLDGVLVPEGLFV
ncbi:MAG: 5-formyltetrahydrofolate cyclo-ligase [Spirochaetales bacterium]|nr:5-formyltetrahydrofolate cyclo-ligase [Spirochaetales bacterium]